MGSNTSMGRGKKGSKYWIQTLINHNNGIKLTDEIKKLDKDIIDIEWKSPLESENYRETKIYEIEGINKDMINFWPNNGPWWDAIGIAKTNEQDTIILVEAKAHTKETKSRCSATSQESIDKINNALEYTHSKLANNQYDDNVWLKSYYQLANRLAFLVHLKEQGVNVKLLLLNIVEDPTHISTSKEEWDTHYEEVFNSMLGSTNAIQDIIILNYKV